MTEVIANCDVWRLNLKLLPPQSSQILAVLKKEELVFFDIVVSVPQNMATVAFVQFLFYLLVQVTKKLSIVWCLIFVQ